VSRVGVVGLGEMGSRIAGRVLHAGHELIVWNRDPAKTGPLVQRGAVVGATPADAAQRSEVVVTMVADPRALAAVTEGVDGVAAGLGSDAALIQMSTVSPAAIERLAGIVPEASLLDAPVLGSISEAEAGTLQIFAGGPAALVERLRPLLLAVGKIIHVGPRGSGTAAKLVANSTLVGVIGVLGEAMALARGLGLPSDVAFDVLAVTPVGAQAERRRPAFESREYPPRFPVSLARKDADLIEEAAAAGGIDLRLARAAQTWLADAERAGRGADDYSAVLEQIVRPDAGTGKAS
jgi:3-hydroxyisobutyrate dehydrogenase